VIVVLLGILLYPLTLNQILQPNVSVALFAFNGIYALFCMTFIPIAAKVFGFNLSSSELLLSFTIIALFHFGMGFGHWQIPGLNSNYWMNPGVTAVFGLIIVFIVILISQFFRKRTLK